MLRLDFGVPTTHSPSIFWAPHSFFNVACQSPPIVQFTSVGREDTQRNVEATGEFVVNFAAEPLRVQINATATDFPPEISEFDAVGLDREPSLRVKPSRVAASPVALESRLHSMLRLGDSTVVFGNVVHAAIAEEVLVNGHPEVGLLRPLCRLGRNEWGTIDEVMRVRRIPYAEWPGTPDIS